MKTKRLRLLSCALCILCVFSSLLLSSCAEKTDEIIIEYATASEAAEVCGLMSVEYIPEGYEPKAYRTVYEYVSETEYTSDAKTVVLRIVSTEYNTSNLSGFTDTGLCDVYTSKDGREFEIETREGVYAAEWQDLFGETQCNLSLVLMGGELEEFKSVLESFLAYNTTDGAD